MAAEGRTALKTYFNTGDTPTEAQFVNLIDSMQNITDDGTALVNVVEDTTPQLGGQLDVNGNAIGDGTNELITFTEDASAVNQVNIENEATGAGPIISAAGDDLNIDLNLSGKGSGAVKVGGNRVLTTGDEGTGNGLDADTLDGSEATAFAAASHNHAASEVTSGTLAHERGGLEADVSAYSGLVKISAGSTSAVTAPTGTVVGTSDAQTLTNKTIDADNNTVSNIGAAEIKADIIDGHTAATIATGDKILFLDATDGSLKEGTYDDLPGAAGGLTNIVEDTTPQLGGELDAQGNNIIGLGDVTFQTGASGGTLRTGTSAADKFTLQAYDVDGAAYTTMLELDAGNTPVITFPEGVDIAASKNLTVNSTAILSDSAGTMTLSNIDALDATTEATIEAAIDTLSNLTTVGTLTSGNADAIVSAASTTTAGKVELATGAEVNTGTDTTRAVTPDALDDWTGSAQITTVGTLASGNADAAVSASSTTTAGKIEIATSAETTTGTDATRAVSPDGLAGSDYGKRHIGILVFSDADDTAVADGAGDVFVRIPSTMNGWNLVDVEACVQTAGTTGTTDIQIHNVTQAADMLSTKITIDSAETDSSTAATAPVIDTANDDVATGDQLRIDVDAVSTTAAKGLFVELTFQKP